MPDSLSEHIHDCTVPGVPCSCGYLFVVPPICFSLDVSDRGETVVSEGFNCESMATVVEELRSIALRLERQR
jgi:hypothetical protein